MKSRNFFVLAFALLFMNFAFAADPGDSPRPLTVLYPNGGEVLEAGALVDIQWMSNAGTPENVQIWLSKDGGRNYDILIAEFKPAFNDPSVQHYTWKVPNTEGTNMRIKINYTYLMALYVADESDNDFTIKTMPAVLVKSPNGGETFIAGNDIKVAWALSGIDAKIIEIGLSTDGGRTYPVTLVKLVEPRPTTQEWTWSNVDYTGNMLRLIVTAYGEKNIEVIFDESDGVFTVLDPTLAPNPNPDLSNFPNPFNPTTTIAFDLGEAGNVKLTVYDLLGREVTTLINGNLSAGHHITQFDAVNLPSGTYMYRLETANDIVTNTMQLTR